MLPVCLSISLSRLVQTSTEAYIRYLVYRNFDIGALVGRMLRSRQEELAQLVYQPMRQRLYIALPAAYRPAV
ncbi:hypothetical protein JMJ77_0013115 [Colletotrichum scovillei]|uniref:Uncharacterized protein n=1 Tax=Colletotrichum scovillei TaxID=1209932 RepID=A0A9P7R7J9_9PEZI|nr:hypothetical protein JMJ77_0013115 [Colletotrichum scovillei]KAG7069406.1 hypothetical protein JMJ76_0003078 [Colletotrichum scovillei]KAG7073393.1 hypothetical protein JMJ78_0014369 [Colletotrichum scovillei]